MTVEASVLKDAQAIGLRGWGLLAAGLVAGAAGGWTIGQYLNERNDRAAVQVRSNLEERLKSAELKAESLQRQLAELQKQRDELQQRVSKVPDCAALTPLVEGKRADVARQEQRVYMSAPTQIRSINERGETVSDAFAASDAQQRERASLAELQNQLRSLEMRQADCISTWRDEAALSESLSTIFCLADLYNPDGEREEYELDEEGLRDEVTKAISVAAS